MVGWIERSEIQQRRKKGTTFVYKKVFVGFRKDLKPTYENHLCHCDEDDRPKRQSKPYMQVGFQKILMTEEYLINIVLDCFPMGMLRDRSARNDKKI